jgi:hypothetical protein
MFQSTRIGNFTRVNIKYVGTYPHCTYPATLTQYFSSKCRRTNSHSPPINRILCLRKNFR